MKPKSAFAAERDTKKDDRLYHFVDEKISDESGTETKSDSALQPTGLNNPFWK
jgi:hypothetical protein